VSEAVSTSVLRDAIAAFRVDHDAEPTEADLAGMCLDPHFDADRRRPERSAETDRRGARRNG